MSTTRLLVLGCLRIFEPTHGYTIERELRSWSADQWAGLNFGSIYHALRQMTKEGFLEVVDDGGAESGRRSKATYRLTHFGEEEYERLLRDQAWSTEGTIDPFSTVLTFAPSLSAEEFVRVLRFRESYARNRAENLEEAAAAFEVSSVAGDGRPWVVPEEMRLIAAHLRASAAWTAQLLGRYERGEIRHAMNQTAGPPLDRDA